MHSRVPFPVTPDPGLAYGRLRAVPRGRVVPSQRGDDTPVIDAALGRTGPEGGPLASRLAVSVVVPSRNEEGNVAPLSDRLAAALAGVPHEIVFVDDSDDGTPEAVESLARRGYDQVRLIHRRPGARPGGLGGAVALGMAQAAGDVVVVLDADLQHPPESVPSLIKPILDQQTDLSIGSRYCPGGHPGGLDGPLRQLASSAARRAVHAMLPELRHVSDPCGGFFAIRRDLLLDAKLRPQGYKVLLEVLVKTNWQTTKDIPYRFQPRLTGSSKFDFAEVRRFARHLRALRLFSNGRPGELPRILLPGSKGDEVQ